MLHYNILYIFWTTLGPFFKCVTWIEQQSNYPKKYCMFLQGKQIQNRESAFTGIPFKNVQTDLIFIN